MQTAFYIGCSGYYYPAWKNKFYPAGVQPKNWLEHYSTVFRTVELNGTFYRTPKLTDLKKYHDVTPEDFRFSVKMGKFITHGARLLDMKQAVTDFQELIREGLEDKLMHYLFQLPPSFHYSEEHLQRILDNIPHREENVIELRHASWWNPEVETAFREAGLTFCNVDYPGMETYFMQTSDSVYYRLHGNPVLFKSSYEEEELREVYAAIPRDCGRAAIYFNNTYFEAGYLNARQLRAIVEEHN